MTGYEVSLSSAAATPTAGPTGDTSPARAALSGRGLELDAELVTQIASARLRDPNDTAALIALHNARGLVNWYLQRPTIAADQFGAVVALTSGIDRVRALANQMLSISQAGDKPTLKMAAEAFPSATDGIEFNPQTSRFVFPEKVQLEGRYLSGIIQLALGDVESAIATWAELLTTLASKAKDAIPLVTIEDLEDLSRQAGEIRERAQRLIGVLRAKAEALKEEDAKPGDIAINAEDFDLESLIKVYLVSPAESRLGGVRVELGSRAMYPRAALPVTAGGPAMLKPVVADALVSALLGQSRTKEARKIWDEHLADFTGGSSDS